MALSEEEKLERAAEAMAEPLFDQESLDPRDAADLVNPFFAELLGVADTEDEEEVEDAGDAGAPPESDDEDEDFDDSEEEVEDPDVEVEEDEEEYADDEDEDDESEEPSDDEPLSTIRVPTEDGGVEEITLEEFDARGLRMADYTRKTQAVAEQKRALQSEAERIQAERAQYAQRLRAFEQAIVQTMPEKEPNWDALKKANPQQYAAEWADYSRKQGQLQQIYAEQQKTQHEMIAAQNKRQAEMVAAEQEKLLSVVPEWRDPDVAREEVTDLVQFAMDSYGYTPEEIQQTYDHRAMLIMRDAKRYRDMKAGNKDVRKNKRAKTKTLKPGSSATKKRPNSKTKRVKKSAERLAQTGAKDAAASLFESVFFEEDGS